MKAVGQPVNRLEGHLKVTGAAKYAAEYEAAGLLYGYVVSSPVTKGKIRSIDDRAARAVDGVVEIITHENRMATAAFDIQYADMDAPPGTVLKPLDNAEIHCNGQPIALVVAADFETARYAASLMRFEFDEQAFETDVFVNIGNARAPKKGLATALKPPPPKPQGDFEKVYAAAPYTVAAEFRHGTEHHNPMELFATTVVYEGKGKLRIYDKTQGTINNQVFVANVFRLRFKDVQVLAPFVGGAFGVGLRPQYQLYLCVMAALMLKRNVRLTLDRAQMFSLGHRPPSLQKLRFCADDSGAITGLNHEAFTETSNYEDYAETIAHWSHKLYPAANTLFKYSVVPLDVFTPIDMRAPGGSTAMHAIECTIDMLAEKLGLDPLELRLRNYTELDPSVEKPYTSKELRQCFLRAADKFGWDKRNPQPRQTQRGNKLIGYGMATGIWDAYQFPSRVEAILGADGRLTIHNAVTDIGTGTLTIMTQIAADAFGLPMEAVDFEYGDSKKPFSMFQGGSGTTASTSTAIIAAAEVMKKKLLKIAKGMDGSQFSAEEGDQVALGEGCLISKSDPVRKVAFTALIEANKGRAIHVKKMGLPKAMKLRKYSKGTHSAAFVEVEVDVELGDVRVTRAVTAVAAGRIVNPKTARSQILGSMIWGISKALHEESVMDHKLGRYVNANLGEYHIPVHADIGELEVIFADEPDELINELGVKGVGEIGLVAMPAAIANAIYNATGKRMNDLPIHFDRLL